MGVNRFRWARLCVAASLSLVSNGAHADRTHTVKSGENLNTLALKFHVSVPDLCRANGLREDSIVALGRKLRIPNPPPKVVAAARIHHETKITDDSVSVRMGPGTDYRRVAVVYKGSAVVVTARRAGWSQIELSEGKTGWVRDDYVRGGRRQVAKRGDDEDRTPARRRRTAPVHALAEDRRTSRRRLARSHAGSHVARKWEETERPRRSARRRRAEHRRLASSRESRRHRLAAMRTERRRHYARARHSHYRYGRRIPEAERPAAANEIVRTAYAYRGTPYVWGGDSRGGFDCSGFTSYLYRKRGVSLPHSASGQFRLGHHVGQGEMKPGDLVFFHTVHAGISHVGMYVGNGRFVHASSRRAGGVRVDSLNSGYYRERLRGARRFSK